jgi:hypothetical protein
MNLLSIESAAAAPGARRTGKRGCAAFAAALALGSAIATRAQSAGVISPGAPARWVHVPGAVIRADCVHEIPAGATLEENGDVTLAGSVVAHYDACPEAPLRTRGAYAGNLGLPGALPGPGNGWIEAVQMQVALNSGDSIDLVSSEWNVPADPAADGGVIFIWIGTEPVLQAVALQAVLQWGAAGGASAEGPIGGNYWVIASWLVGKNAYHSEGIRVSAGDRIFGSTYIGGLSSHGRFDWESWVIDTTTGAVSELKVRTSVRMWNWAYSGVLEGYGIASCADLPRGGSMVFENNTVLHGYPSFERVTADWWGAFYDFGGQGGPSCAYRQAVDGSLNYLFW